MKIVIISDTHGRVQELGALSGDVLIYYGDLLNLFDRREGEVAEVDAYSAHQSFDLSLSIGGNHDLALEARLKSGRSPLRNARILMDDAFAYGVVRP